MHITSRQRGCTRGKTLRIMHELQGERRKRSQMQEGGEHFTFKNSQRLKKRTSNSCVCTDWNSSYTSICRQSRRSKGLFPCLDAFHTTSDRQIDTNFLCCPRWHLLPHTHQGHTVLQVCGHLKTAGKHFQRFD